MESVNGVEATISARDVGEQVLKLFWDLASLNEDARATAAAGLVAELKKIEEDFANGAGTNEHSPSLVYGLKRLVRGLASGRQGARQGCALALTHLLPAVPHLPITQVLAVMASELEVSGQAKGSEAHDQLLGQVFGYAAIIRSGQQMDQQTAVRCAEGLTHIANRKSFLRELATNVFLELTDQVQPDDLQFILSKDSCGVKAWLLAPITQSSPEALLLALRLWGSLPPALLAQTGLLPPGAQPPPAAYFTDPDSAKDAAVGAAAAFFSEQHLQMLSPVLKGSSSSHPRLHSLWPTLLALLLPGFKAVKDQEVTEDGKAGGRGTAGAGQLEALWTLIVQDLFTSSHERKALGFQLFTILLPFLRPDQMPAVFSSQFLRCFTNNLSNASTYLHSSAQRCARRIVDFADKTKAIPSMQTALAVALQGVGGRGFDKLTKTDTVAKLLQNLDTADLESYVQRLQDHFCKGSKPGSNGDDDQDIEKARQVAVEQIADVAAIKSVPVIVKTRVLNFLAMHAFFAVDKAALGKGKPKEVKAAVQAQPAPSTPTRQMCAARLISLLDSATKAAQAPPAPLATKKPQGKKRKAAELTAEVVPAAAAEAVPAARLDSPFLTEVVVFVSKVQRTTGVSLAAELPEEMDEALSKLRESEALAATKLTAGATGVQAQQVRCLLALMRWLQLYILADPASAQPDVAADLEGVFKGAFTNSKAAAGEPHWMDVLVDILLSLLGRSGDALPFGPLREACEGLFRAFAEQVTPQGFADLVRVVQQAPEGQDDEEEDEVFEDEDEDMLAGVEDGPAANGTDDAESDEDEDEEDDSEEDEALNTALDGAAAATDASDSSDEEDFDDDQMFQMDDKIAAALRVMARGGANARESREAISAFKFRVIGLIEAYIKKVPSSPLLPAALPALLGALTGACQQGGDAALAKRLQALLMAFTKGQAQALPSASGEGGGLPEGEAMAGLLKRTLYLASRHKDKKVTSAASTAFNYLLRSSVTAQGVPTGEAETAVKAALDDFFGKKKSKLHRKLFEEVMARATVLSKGTLLPAIVQHIHTARSGFVKADGSALLVAFLRSSKGLQSAGGVAEAFRQHVPVLAELAVAATSGDVAQSARQKEALKDTCVCFEQLAQVYPDKSLQDVMGQHQIQYVLASVRKAEAADPKTKIAAQLKRLLHLLSEANTTVPFSQRVKLSGSKKASKKAKKDQAKPVALTGDRGKAQKAQKGGMRPKSALEQPAAPKRIKNKDKYKKKGNKDKRNGKQQASQAAMH